MVYISGALGALRRWEWGEELKQSGGQNPPALDRAMASVI